MIIQEINERVFKIFNHPYKFLYNNLIEAWHSANPFYVGYNIHHDFKAPTKSLYPQETVEQLFDEFEKIIDYVLQKGVVFKNTSGLAEPYRLKNPDYIGIGRLIEIAAEFEKNFDWIENREEHFSPAEVFGMLVYALNRYFANGTLPGKIPVRRLLGPTSVMKQGKKADISLKSLKNRLKICDTEMDFHRAVPYAIELCGNNFAPGDLRLSLVELLSLISKGTKIDELITIHPG